MSGISERGVIVCKCQGKVSESLPVDDICRFLEQKKPGLRVVLADNLCKPEVLTKVIEEQGLRPMVIGACSQLSLKLPFWKEPGRNTVDAYSSRIVDLIGEIKSWSDPADLFNRIRLILWAQLARQEKFTGTPPEAVKLQFMKPQGKSSRRQLFSRLLPQHQIIPYIQRDRCAGIEKCSICRKSCPFNAIVTEGQLSIDKTRCRGCGACVAVCPHQAIYYPAFSFDQMDQELEGLLLADGDKLEPRIIAIVCQSCRSSSDEKGKSNLCSAPNIFTIEVPCLDMVSPWLILRAFDQGAQGIALIDNKESCKFGLSCGQWQSKIQFVQQILEQWGIEAERIKVFQDGDLEQQLTQFSQGMAQLPATPLRFIEPATIEEHALALPSLVSNLTEKLAPLSRETISTGNVPFGSLGIDISNCTACGLCVDKCPTEALKLVENERSYQLYFHPRSCAGCGQCVDICPERCLHVENILELGKINNPSEVIFESEITRCSKCGEPMVAATLTDKLRNILGRTEGLTSQLDTCVPCKMKSISGIPAGVIGV